mmetsp:Transcript_37443/g.92115  ORF Transcript_37443/g.92115 Transcript_37443/m.92115 type:complete len:314 (-) Transcript_37443:245-1186(-)|eukprot:CAMPEP_0206273552 /NCGR_PEP_ID=MMETSP0047_2-20121206/34663_1 /ASSEMBLY_ACC=CAM_ASM_000192 /TAXON_ID=195065 /ORGANISM="Chroomonas mesostigmatica_cf, Strain CCMP1168" /LENGTH=313 /DNA_ID=CAMNT_0053702669 /DNA_START=892 /DNA_END=1833 /DNA_ORIENTATION=-
MFLCWGASGEGKDHWRELAAGRGAEDGRVVRAGGGLALLLGRCGRAVGDGGQCIHLLDPLYEKHPQGAGGAVLDGVGSNGPALKKGRAAHDAAEVRAAVLVRLRVVAEVDDVVGVDLREVHEARLEPACAQGGEEGVLAGGVEESVREVACEFGEVGHREAVRELALGLEGGAGEEEIDIRVPVLHTVVEHREAAHVHEHLHELLGVVPVACAHGLCDLLPTVGDHLSEPPERQLVPEVAGAGVQPRHREDGALPVDVEDVGEQHGVPVEEEAPVQHVGQRLVGVGRKDAPQQRVGVVHQRRAPHLVQGAAHV